MIPSFGVVMTPAGTTAFWLASDAMISLRLTLIAASFSGEKVR